MYDDFQIMGGYWEASCPDRFMILPYQPKFACPHCGWANGWGGTSGFTAENSWKLWKGESLCVPCGKQTTWLLDPDKTLENQTEAMHRPLGGEATPTPKLLSSDYDKPKGVTKHDIPSDMSPDGGVGKLHPYQRTPQQDEAIKRFLDRIRKWSEEQRKDDDDDWTDNLPKQSDYD